MKIRLLLLFVALCVPQVALGRWFSSSKALEELIELEQKMSQVIQQCIAHRQHDELDAEFGEEIVAEMEQQLEHAQTESEYFWGNPVNVFSILYDMTVGARFISAQPKHYSSFIREHLSDFLYQGAIKEYSRLLVMLQNTYRISVDEMVQGALPGVAPAVIPMKADHCFQIGKFVMQDDDYQNSYQWLKKADELLADEIDKSLDQNFLLEYYQYAAFKVGQVEEAHHLTTRLLDADPDNQEWMGTVMYYNNIRDNGGSMEVDEFPEVEYEPYGSLCRGNTNLPEKSNPDLYCSERHAGGVFYLDPLKEEVLSHDPWIAVYHDAISDTDMTSAILSAHAKMPAPWSKTNEDYLEDLQYARNVSLEKDFTAATLKAKMAEISGFSASPEDHLQVLNYAPGGHFLPHLDFVAKKQKVRRKRGNKMATVSCYLHKPNSGGHHVFSELGMRVAPEKGACVVWYSLTPTGRGQTKTYNGVCPVLSGTAWTLNLWIEERRKQCRT